MLPSELLQPMLQLHPRGQAVSKLCMHAPTLTAEGQVVGFSFFESCLIVNSMKQWPQMIGFLKIAEAWPKLPTIWFEDARATQGGLMISLGIKAVAISALCLTNLSDPSQLSLEVTEPTSSYLGLLETLSVSNSSDCTTLLSAALAFFFSLRASLLRRRMGFERGEEMLGSSRLEMQGSRVSSGPSLALFFSSITKLKMLKYPVPFIRKQTLNLNCLSYQTTLDFSQERLPQGLIQRKSKLFVRVLIIVNYIFWK